MGYIIENDDLSKREVEKIYVDLSNWVAEDASFLLSKESLKAYYALRNSLLVKPKNEQKYSREQRKNMWTAKNRFRGCLRNDVNLLFREDEKAEA